MITYFDSSVVLRRVLRQPGGLEDWKHIDQMVSSRLLEVESLRALDRFRLRREVSVEALSAARRELEDIFEGFIFIEMDRAVLERASGPMPAALGTLDAIHLATALLWREESGVDVAVATHDAELAGASRLYGLRVLGA